jgi:electron transfer flavoprotein alpha subunit
MPGIWVFGEGRDQTLELLNAGRNAAKAFETKLVAFTPNRPLAQEYIAHGADEVFVLPPLAAGQPLESYVPVLAETARQEDPDIFFIAATARGKEMAARVATRLETGLCSGCTGFGFDQERKLLRMERMVFGGAAVQRVMCTTRPQMATIPPRTFEPATIQDGRTGTISELPSAPLSAVKVIKRSPKTKAEVNITEARIVVCVGRGLNKKEDVELARQLAHVLGGEVGCTRPIAEELRWLPEDVYLGISGKKIKPDLYIGLGISGQIQHVTGIRDSKVILAVNRDENAPIFEAADYGIVGDLYQVVPKLIEELKAALLR